MKLITLFENDYDEEADEAAEMKMIEELKPLKKQLDDIMSRYPHASYDDVLHWLKQ